MHNIHIYKKIFQKYYMHLLGIVGFSSMLLLSTIGLLKHDYDLIKYVPYGIVLFIINLIYLKIILLSRNDYEEKLKKEKEYSQSLLVSQKLFLRHAVHETNTPLSVIMANIELYELEFGKHTMLSNIEAATKNIHGIYDDLSYLTKKDHIFYPKKEIILLDFIKARLDFFNIVALQSQLSFDIHPNCSHASICINETKLQRIVDNNITNALKYTREFESIHIMVFEEEEKTIFEISSNSSLIKDTKKIFDAYYREGNQQEGLGLGLNLVKKICQEEDIEIELISNQNVTSFKYYFKKVSL